MDLRLSSAVWLAPASGSAAPASLCVFLATSTAAAIPAAFVLDMIEYGFGGATSFNVALIGRDGKQTKLATVKGSMVRLNRTVAGRSVEMLEVTPGVQ